MPVLANGTESAMAFSGRHARVFASMECRRGHAGQGYPAGRVTPGLSCSRLVSRDVMFYPRNRDVMFYPRMRREVVPNGVLVL